MLGYFRRSRYFALLGKNINDGCSRFRRSSGLFYSLPRYCGVAALSLPIGLSNGRSAHSKSICSDFLTAPEAGQARKHGRRDDEARSSSLPESRSAAKGTVERQVSALPVFLALKNVDMTAVQSMWVSVCRRVTG